MSYEVYIISCSVTGKVYVGYTKCGAHKRFKRHLSDARSQTNTALGDAIRLHGEEAFSVSTVWRGETLAEAYEAEVRFIAEMNTLTPNGYNITPGGPGTRRTRRVYAKTGPRGPMPQETRDKIRQAKLGKPRSQETKEKLRVANLGKKHSAEAREKIRVAGTGRKHSAETREKMSRVQAGRTFSDESREKMRASHTGRKRSPESIQKQVKTWVRKLASTKHTIEGLSA